MEQTKKIDIRQYLYYSLIFGISVVVLVFLPMVGSSFDAGFNFPKTAAAWGVYIFSKLLTAILNVLIYHCFIQQAKVNVSKNETYIAARALLNRAKSQADKKPMSESTFLRKQYSSKAVMLFVTTLASAFTLTNAILTYDYITLLTYSLTIFIGVVFGIIEMKKVENYYLNEFISYAQMVDKEIKQNVPLSSPEIGLEDTKGEKL